MIFHAVLLAVAAQSPAWDPNVPRFDGGVVEVQAGAPDAGAAAPAIDEFAPVAEAPAPIESFEAPPAGPSGQLKGWWRSQLGVDTLFESAVGDDLAENVVELKSRLSIAVDVKVNDRIRLLLEGRARWRGVAQRELYRTKATFEPSLGEAFVDLYTERVDLRAGNQVVAFGANAAFAPADGLNPRDLREGMLLAEPEDGKLPAPALRAAGELGKVSLTAAYFPFFTAHQYAVFGQDEALVQPGLGANIPSRVHESIEDQLQPHLLESERPRALPWLGDFGLRATGEINKVKVGASWVWMNEKLPQVRVDPELTSLLTARARGREADPATALSVQNRLLGGERLFNGTYERQHVLSAEASALVGSVQLDADLAFSPRQTFVDLDLNPISKSAVTWVLGASQASDSPLIYAVTYVGMAVPDVEADKLLALIEPTTAQGAPRTAWLHLVVASASYSLMNDELELTLRAAFEPIQRSFGLAPRVSYRRWERVTLWLGAEWYQGPQYSPFGYYGRNDQILAGANVDLF